MSKGILEFNLPEEQEEFNDAAKGGAYKYTIEDIWQKVFRPAFKHGYDAKVESIIEKCGHYADGEGNIFYHAHDLIEELSEIFVQITKEEE